ncbi:TNF receptor-associated factor 6-like [Dreissena polymorpha]|uniref:Uncharacterized protein n=1 Tax=Dreissena polymorpha TaxID=45954 RepID=A0A9D4LQI3_DREPO|nr:TNF receptor-associated factor 6-like [Dreissena polymorpha]XP_052262793.1 TNF receptor-associated factor 6-like [Dreissena polymorpha]XP_052262795.1 TNF receptor-associated factor 6-like [Dreissena polymorpha]XP_052262796.1 TNF receptor-associated factor 6-like [Dreissena polymorpha]KAH3862883.1 hypothetical protein DPMN_025858 [Dreissena polymorpha]
MATDGVLGYDVIFSGEPDRKYVCPICLVVMRDAVQTTCGHRFCRECIVQVASRSHPKCKCPVDNTWFNIQQEMFPDVAVQREILSLEVKCDQVSAGCPWHGELRDLQNHLLGCGFIEVECEFGCSRQKVLRCELDRHQENCDRRPVTCEHCNDSMPCIELTRHQLLDCKKLPLGCTQCGQCGIQRGGIQRHLDLDCPKAMVPCPYLKYGCTHKGKRDEISNHEKMASEKHLAMLKLQTEQQNYRMKVMETEISQLASLLESQKLIMEEKIITLTEHQRHSFNGRLQWKISLLPGQTKYTSPSFYTGLPGYKLHMCLELKGHMERDVSYASMFVILEKGEYDDEIFFPFNARVKAMVLSVDPDLNQNVAPVLIHCRNIPRCNAEGVVFNSLRGRLRFMQTDHLLSSQFCVNNTIFLGIKVADI